MENQTDLHACARAYARQHHRGKIFLHEAPIRSITWKNRDISWITSFPEVFKIKGPICRWKVCKGDVNSVGYIRQAICWMTNDGRLAHMLAWIREASFACGLDRSGAMFPPNLVTAVLKVIKRNVLDQQVISAVELQSGGPTAELPELWNQPDYMEYWDDVNGGFLDPRLVREARLLELGWIKKDRVFDYRSRTEAKKKGIKPIPLMWVETNKGDKNTPFVRSRICVRECKKGRNAVESLEPEQLFSAMPPLEPSKLLCSLKVSMKTSRKGNPLKLAHFDISRTHFMPKARRELYVELPDEDPMKQKGFVGLLLRSMYGTQDASNLWQEDYTEALAQRGYKPGRSNPAMFHSHQGDGRMLVHGDDFVLLADDGEIKAVEQLLQSKYTVKVVAVIGDGSSQQEAVILNRIVRYVPPNSTNRMAMEIEPDQRDVDILLRKHGLDDSRSKGVDTMRVKKSESQVFAGLESPLWIEKV